MTLAIAPRADNLFRVLDTNHNGKLDAKEAPFLKLAGKTQVTADVFVADLQAVGLRNQAIEDLDARATQAVQLDQAATPNAGKRVGAFFAGFAWALLGAIIAPFQCVGALIVAAATGNFNNFIVSWNFPWVIVADHMQTAFDPSSKSYARGLADEIRSELDARAP